jgi:hypothetical protein
LTKKKRCKYINFEDDNYRNKNMNNKYDKIVVKKKKIENTKCMHLYITKGDKQRFLKENKEKKEYNQPYRCVYP